MGHDDRHRPNADVAVCTGSSCRRRDEHVQLLERLGEANLRPLGFGCADICTGPVLVVTPPDGSPVVLRRVRSPKARRDVVRLARGRALSERLRRREVRGSKAAKAIRKVRRARAAKG
ncbi:MAG: hypothetical protein R2713_04520 [Ilumatobacteraceae bacterium]|nr:hypothetical protein [Acidimicrobiales bacterium]